MIVCKVYKDYKEVLVNVYENEEEFSATGLQFTQPATAQPGDYIRTDNGYYVPVLRRSELHPTHGKVESMISLFVPRNKFIIYKYRSGNIRINHLIWYRDAEPVKPKFLSGKAKLVIRLVNEGMTLDKAFLAVYKCSSKYKLEQMISQLMDIPEFYNSIVRSYMDKLGNSLQQIKADHKWLAKKLVDIVNDDKASPALKQFALSIIKDSLDRTQEETKINTTVVHDFKSKLQANN